MKLVYAPDRTEGREVRVLLVEEGLPIDKEFLSGHCAGPSLRKPVFMASAAGGMDIEESSSKDT